MCGFAGQRLREPAGEGRLERSAAAMIAALRHRGPDAEGRWIDPPRRTLLAFARLAIQDLSPAANQPMVSESGRFVIVYNGEIYNVDELRQLISRPASSFVTHSDTEVLLAVIEARGLERTLVHANGMFAIALWDTREQTLLLARDRLGKKPLHYELGPDRFTFGSELKAILAGDPAPRATSADAIRAYFTLNYIPAPLSIFTNVHKVRPGHILRLGADWRITETRYWSLDDVLARREYERVSHEEIVERTAGLLEDATRRRLVGDVPVGVLLSGGVDSSLVAEVIAQRLQVPLRSFTIAVDDKEYDESAQASAIARAVGIENVPLRLTPADALGLVDRVVETLDEPFGDFSALPTFAVCQLARHHATVLLTGDGGDEVFGGYTRYTYANGWRAAAMQLYARWRSGRLALPRRRMALEIYRRLMTVGPARGSMPAGELAEWAADLQLPAEASLLDHLRYLDFQLYLPDDILVKTDRMAMASSAELRSPFLDHRLVEWSWQLPEAELVQGSRRKRVTRELFEQRIGSHYLQPRKFGFGIPIGDWLRGPLREQVETAIGELAGRTDLPPHVVPHAWWSGLQRDSTRWMHRVWLLYVFWRWSEHWEKAGRVPAGAVDVAGPTLPSLAPAPARGHSAVEVAEPTPSPMARARARGHIVYLTLDGLLEPLGRSQIVRFIERLAALGFRYTVVSLEKEWDLAQQTEVAALRARLEALGIRWVFAPYAWGGGVARFARNWANVFALAAHATRRHPADLLHVRGHVPASIACVLQPLTGTPYLFDVRGYWIDEKVSETGGLLGRLAYRTGKGLERLLARRAAGLVTLNSLIAADLRDQVLRGREFPQAVIPTCADYDAFTPAGDFAQVMAPQLLARLRGKLVVVWLGAVRPSYYTDESLRLFRHVLELRRDAHLLGITQQPEALQRALSLNGIPEAAYTVATARHHETPAWLRLADWGLLLLVEQLSSRGAMPTKLAEFFAAGVRVVQYGGNGEVREAVRAAGKGIVLHDLTEESLRAAAGEIALSPGAGAAKNWAARDATRPRFGLEAGVERYRQVLQAAMRGQT